ncbi:hypothetical protein EV421DRAFT_1989722 [Armillaria borealis]|uniref:Uncharacterized protein n=1 Tax=Armillaria borealis TaxID=47425 RepID=A0AA39JWH9_9AGAR|nr:hypothetical protein EV421DRAFT_1989722 [Armillaria borealis]
MHGRPSTSMPPSKWNKSSRFTTSTPAQAVSNSASSSKLSDQPTSTFYSCISIPVEGAIPIEDEPTQDSRTPLPEPSSEQKLAPRKSKTDALAAMKDREILYSVDRVAHTHPRSRKLDTLRVSRVVQHGGGNLHGFPCLLPLLHLLAFAASNIIAPGPVFRRLTNCKLES